MKTWGGGGNHESHQKLLRGSLQWRNIQRGDPLNFTLVSPKSSALPAINHDRSLMVMGRHLLDKGRLIVRGVYYKQCVESRLIWDKGQAFICIWKGASTRSCMSFDVSVSLVKHINDDLLYLDQCTNFKSSWPFQTVVRLDDKLRVSDILEEYKSRVEEG